jgi:hypothetical protein
MRPEQITEQRQRAAKLRELPDHELVAVLLLVEWAALHARNGQQSEPAKRLLRLMERPSSDSAPGGSR